MVGDTGVWGSKGSEQSWGAKLFWAGKIPGATILLSGCKTILELGKLGGPQKYWVAILGAKLF